MRHKDHSGETQEAHGVWMHAHRPVRTTQRLEFTNLDSLIPSMARLYLFISVATCAVFPASNMVLTFHVPMVVVTPVERMVFGRVASRCFWLSPPCVINPSDEGPSSLRGGISWFTLVCVSVTGIVLWGGVVSPTPNPQPGGPGVAFSRTSTLKPARLGKTCQGYYPRRYSLQGHGSTQASPPRQGNNTEGRRH